MIFPHRKYVKLKMYIWRFVIGKKKSIKKKVVLGKINGINPKKTVKI